MKVFVTTGAIVPFRELIESCLDKNVINELAGLGYTEIVVQYGKGEDIYKAARPEHPEIKISGFDFTNDINQYIESSSLVISHAGTGSILDAVRGHRALIVMVNPRLMNNHQMAIASEFSRYGYLLVTNPSPSDLSTALIKSQHYPFKKIPPANSVQVAKIIDTEAGLQS